MSDASPTAGREIRIRRVINAPRERVFQVWTDPDHIGNWWGPDGFTTTTISMEVRPGGRWKYIMHGPDGTDYQNLITYREVAHPNRLVYDHGATEEDAEHFIVTVEFREADGRTELNMSMLFATAELRDQVVKAAGALEGAQQTMARLESYLVAVSG
jgi:uncharacterized protein YndB with AHSA1/START domain